MKRKHTETREGSVHSEYSFGLGFDFSDPSSPQANKIPASVSAQSGADITSPLQSPRPAAVKWGEVISREVEALEGGSVMSHPGSIAGSVGTFGTPGTAYCAIAAYNAITAAQNVNPNLYPGDTEEAPGDADAAMTFVANLDLETLGEQTQNVAVNLAEHFE